MLCRRLLQAPAFARPLAGRGLRGAAAASPAEGAGEEPSRTAESSTGAAPDAGGTGRKSRREKPDVKVLSVKEQVDKHVKSLHEHAGGDAFHTSWRGNPGHQVPYRFRIQTPPERQPGQQREQGKQEVEAPYSDHAGLRFPTLETAENFDYHKDKGLDRVVERSYPIKVPGYRRLDPYLREYIHFLHDLDPARFTLSRIAQRYRLREKTVAKVVQEWGVNRYLTRSGLTKLKDKQVTREAETLAKKEQQYAKWVGYDQLGDEEDPESDDEALGEFKGWRATNDWIRRQNVEVEMMSAFPMMEKRDPMPKRVDIDLTVDSRQHHKIINWIDPTDKVVF